MAIAEYDDEKILINDLLLDEKNKFFNGIINEEAAHNIYFPKKMPPKSIDTIFITDNYNIYTLFNCFFKLKNNNLTIYFDTLIVGAKIKDFYNIQCSEISLSFNHTKFNMVDVEESLGKEIHFRRNDKEYKILFNFKPREYILIIHSYKKMLVKNLIRRLLEFYTFISFSVGQYYLINNIKLIIEDKEILYYPKLNGKYNVKKKDVFTNQVLFKLKEIKIANLYHNWLLMRKKTHAIFDLYLAALAEFQFDDVSLSFMINILEGYSKVMHSKELKQLNIYNKNSNRKTTELNVILEHFYFQGTYSNLILSKKERKKYKTNIRLVNHRNYFDHLDEKKDRYYGHDCTTIFAKLNLIFRVQIFSDLGLNLEINKIKNNIDKINRV